MQLNMRPYQGIEDFWRVRAFLRDTLVRNSYHTINWHVMRFDYWRWHGVENLMKVPMEQTVFLWETPDCQLAAVLNPEDGGDAFLQTNPDMRTPALLDEMVGVAEEHLAVTEESGQRRLRVWVAQADCDGIETVMRRGYSRGSNYEYMRMRRLDTPFPEAFPPAGYTVRPLGDGLELLERCYASGLGFHEGDIRIAVDNRNDPTWYRNIQNAPLYRRDLDIVAIAPDGSIVSFCTVWFDDANLTAVFEPVATLPAHRRLGLGKAVMAEGLRRLKRMGAARVYVSSYSPEAGALYACMGFTEYDLLVPWNKRW